MKKIGIVLLLIFLVVELSASAKTDSRVYICGESKVYHVDKSCRALMRCKKKVTTMKRSQAEALGKRVCRIR